MNDFIPPAKPVIGDEEREAVDRVLRSGMLAQGPEVAAFETEFCRALRLGPPCVAVNSGTSGQHLGLLASGVGPGDEVIVPSFTFAATANSVALTGATPVFADIDADDFCLSPAAVESAISERTVGIMPVHLYGHPAKMDRIMSTSLSGSACGCSRTPRRPTARPFMAPLSGAFGTFGMFSLYPTKNMTSGEGGMVAVGDPEVERRMRLLRNQGMERQYHNELVGLNNRMTDIHAAIGRVQLTKVGAWTAQRQQNAAHYDATPRGRGDAAGSRRRRARLPPVHDPGPPRPRWLLGCPARGVRRRVGDVLPRAEPPARPVPDG